MKISLVFPILLFSSTSLHYSLNKSFFSILAILSNSAFRWVYLSFSPLPFSSLLFSAICNPSSDSNFSFLHFFFLGMVWSLPPIQCYKPLSIVLQALYQIIPLIYLTLLLRVWFRPYLNGLVVCPTFFNLCLTFPIRSSWSEPQSTPGLVFADYIELLHLQLQNIINLILGMTIWWCPCVGSSLVFLEEAGMTSIFSWQNSVSLCPASFFTSRPKLPVTPSISWLPTFAFQSPMMKRTSLFCTVYKIYNAYCINSR